MAQSKKRKAPIIKYALEEYTGTIQHPIEGDIIYSKEIINGHLTKAEDYRIVFDACVFKNTTIQSNVFKRSEFIDCTFIDCDLSNNEFHNSTLMRCEFINTRLTGSHFIDSYLSHILIDKSHCNYVDFADSKLELCEFQDSLFQESNFYDSEIKQMTFKRLKLESSTFYQSPMKGVDLSDSEIYQIKTDLQSIKGTIISSFQAREVCHLLGIKVID